MEILVVDSDPAARAVLLGRLQELKRAHELQTIEPIPVLPRQIAERSFASVVAVILGQGLSSAPDSVIEALRQKAHCPIAALFHPAPAGTVSLVADSDDALKVFLVQSLARSQLAKLAEARRIIGVAQMVGGAGATTTVIELGKLLASQGIVTTLVDFDDVGAALSAWGKAAPRYRAAVSDALLSGSVGDATLEELLSPVQERLSIVPQPDSYAESFHFKANVIEKAPVSSVMINSLLSSLRTRDHTVIIDLGRSWGLATFAALPRCGQIVLVAPGDSVERLKGSIDILRRLKKESDSPEEFDMLRWSIVTTHTPAPIGSDIRQFLSTTNLFPDSVSIISLPAPSDPAFAAELARVAKSLQ